MELCFVDGFVDFSNRRAAAQAFKEAKIGPKDVQVVELHDCFSANELISYEALGIAETGKAEDFVNSGRGRLGGAGPIVNPSGGLISKGHPLGATGLAQWWANFAHFVFRLSRLFCSAELCWQLRGMAGPRQVKARNALQHNVGLGGACVVTVYSLGFPQQLKPFPKAR